VEYCRDPSDPDPVLIVEVPFVMQFSVVDTIQIPLA
jgi:hypothetical protein